MIFSGRDLKGEQRTQDPRFHAWIQKASLAFWDAYLRGDAAAKAWLQGAGARGVMQAADQWQRK
jgi:hypothetical protein